MPEAGLMAIVAVIISAYFIAIGSVYLKRGSEALSFNVKKVLRNQDLVIGSALYFLSGLIFLVALRFNDCQYSLSFQRD